MFSSTFVQILFYNYSNTITILSLDILTEDFYEKYTTVVCLFLLCFVLFCLFVWFCFVFLLEANDFSGENLKFSIFEPKSSMFILLT